MLKPRLQLLLDLGLTVVRLGQQVVHLVFLCWTSPRTAGPMLLPRAVRRLLSGIAVLTNLRAQLCRSVQ